MSDIMKRKCRQNEELNNILELLRYSKRQNSKLGTYQVIQTETEDEEK